MIIHKVYIVPENGVTSEKREVIFPEELEAIIRPLIIELTVCREAFRFDAKQYRAEKREIIAEMCEERVERVDAVLREAPGPFTKGFSNCQENIVGWADEKKEMEQKASDRGLDTLIQEGSK